MKNTPDPVYIVTRQGGPILNQGGIVAKGENIASVEIDMRSKHCNVFAESEGDDSGPTIWLDGTTCGLYLKHGWETDTTEVAFPAFRGWEIFSAHVCRYTFRVCFVKNPTP